MKRATTVTVPQIDGETRTEHGYSVTLSPEAFMAAMNQGASDLGACKVGRSWYYKADETHEVYRLTDREIAAYGAGRIDDRGVDYSLWCSYTGALVKRPSKAVRENLGI